MLQVKVLQFGMIATNKKKGTPHKCDVPFVKQITTESLH
jgi:hypothetical protein